MTWSRTSDELVAFAASSCPIVITDATLSDNPITFANSAFSTMTGYSLPEILNRNCRFLQGPDTDPLVRAEIGTAIAAGRAIRHEILNYRKDGTPFWNDIAIDPIRDAAGRVTGFVSIQRNADATHFATAEKAEAESRLARIADHIPGYIYQRVMRRDGSIDVLFLSPSLRRLLGIPESEDSPQFYDYVHPDDRATLFASIRSSATDMSMFREEFRLISRDGSVHWLRSDAPPRRMPNGEIVWDGLAMEIAAETRWESEIAQQALRDPLTGLLTRAAGRQAVEAQLSASGVHASRCGVIHLDISKFGKLNQRLGQSAGNEVLKETARRLSTIAGSVGGIGTRLGGDEFGLLIPSCAGENTLSDLARSLSDALAMPMMIDGQPLKIGVCLGATLCRPMESSAAVGEPDADELMTQAELALRWAKQGGCVRPVLYSQEQDDRFSNQTVLEHSLKLAIENDELELHYQPLVDIASGRILSAEALVRWKHPTLGLQRPDIFIPMAEELGLIGPLGRWALRRAMSQSKQWRSAGLSPPPIAINVSAKQLLEPNFVAEIEELLASVGVDACNFELELTEGLLIGPSPQVLTSLHALRAIGFTIAIDDFGSGHATFRYLRDFPVDKLKLDQVFVRKLVLESTDALIIRAVISLARSMSISFVAEGIETEMQRAFLEREGCRIGQGYFFSMPLVPEDFGWLLANDVRLPLRSITALQNEAGTE